MKRRFSFLRFLLLLALALALFGAVMGYWGYKEFEKDLPDRWTTLTDYRPHKATRVYSGEGELIGEFYLEKRIVVPYEKIPRHVKNAFVAAEDNRFFDHHGIDPVGILRAALANLKAGRVVQGGSTITQQVAKLMLVGNERNVFRKIREAILAHKIESRLSKDQILALYMNHAYLGHGAYGVQAAAEIYFGKDVGELDVAEAALLGGLPKAPTEDSPFNAFPRAKSRQRYVLDQMAENGFISVEEAAAARKQPIAIISRDSPLNHVAAPYFVEHVRKYIQQKYGGRQLYDHGLHIFTSLVMRQQRAAEEAVRHGLDDLDKRLGFRGPVGHLDGDERDRFLAAGPVPHIATRDEGKPAARSSPARVATVKGDKPGTREPDPEPDPDGAPARRPEPPPLPSDPSAGALLVDKPYLGMVEHLGKGKGGKLQVTLRVGLEKLALADDDAARVERWLQKRGHKLAPGDLLPVKLVKMESRVTRHGKRVVETQRLLALAQRPDVQSALVAVDPATGFLTAMVGGYDYELSQFNRAVQARRQAGSSIKPYIYAAAIEKGFTELTMVADAPVRIQTASGIWSPHNYKEEFLGPVTLRTALAKSLNTVAVRLVESVGVDNTIEMFRRFGLTSPIVRHPSIALGVPELSPMEAAYAQATFPAMGLQVDPIFITRVVDADGNVLEEHKPPAPAGGAGESGPPRRRRIPADTAFIMVDLMKNVVQNGTGKKALALGRPAAGKTGTSNDFKDAWFVGYTSDLLAVVWVGRDDFKTIAYDATGGQTALPIWLQFMQHGHPDTPVRDFAPPPGILFVRALPDRGVPAHAGAPGSLLIPFKRGTLPRDFAEGEARAEFSDERF